MMRSSNWCTVFMEMVEDDNHLHHSLLVKFIPLKIYCFGFVSFLFFFFPGLLHDLCVAVFLKELIMGSRFLSPV